MTTISIAMTTYKGSFIDEQLRSLAMQTRLPDELIIADDGSFDDVTRKVDAFSRSVPFPVRHLRGRSRLGVHMNFDRAVAHATGDLVLMSDDDDIWFPEKLETIENVFDEDPSVLCVVNDQEIADADCKPLGRTVLGNVRRLGYSDDHYDTGSCTSFRRAIIPVLLPFPGDAVAYDHWSNILPHRLGVRRVLERPLQLYRRHDNNLTASLLARKNASVLSMIGGAAINRREAYRRQIVGLDLQSRRLEERREELAKLGLASAVERAIVEIGAERDDTEARLRVVSRPRLARPFLVAQHLATGRYRRFQGWRSAAKDLVAA